MPDKHQQALKRQEQAQKQLEDAMQRQEPQTERDKQLHDQVAWLTRQ